MSFLSEYYGICLCLWKSKWMSMASDPTNSSWSLWICLSIFTSCTCGSRVSCSRTVTGKPVPTLYTQTPMLAQLILNKVSFDTILEFLKIKKELTVQVLFGVEQVSKMEPEIYKNNCYYRIYSVKLLFQKSSEQWKTA